MILIRGKYFSDLVVNQFKICCSVQVVIRIVLIRRSFSRLIPGHFFPLSHFKNRSHDRFILNNQLIRGNPQAALQSFPQGSSFFTQFTSVLEVFPKIFYLQAELAKFSVLRNQSSHLTSTKESISIVINVCITYYMHRSCVYHASQNHA